MRLDYRPGGRHAIALIHTRKGFFMKASTARVAEANAPAVEHYKAMRAAVLDMSAADRTLCEIVVTASSRCWDMRVRSSFMPSACSSRGVEAAARAGGSRRSRRHAGNPAGSAGARLDPTGFRSDRVGLIETDPAVKTPFSAVHEAYSGSPPWGSTSSATSTRFHPLYVPMIATSSRIAWSL